MTVKAELEPFVVCTKFDNTDISKQHDFSATACIDGVALHLVQQARVSQSQRSQQSQQQQQQPINAQPFVDAFEQRLVALQKLRKVTARKLGDLEDLCQAAASSYQSQQDEQKQTHATAVSEFRTLEQHVNEIGASAITTGEQLKSLDRQRMLAQEAQELLAYFVDFNAGNTSKMDALLRRDSESKWDGYRQCADLLKRLHQLAKEVEQIKATEVACKSIAAYSELLEKTLLEQFDQAYKESNVGRMHDCAAILTEFNGGGSCVSAYVNQHQFFLTHMNAVPQSTSSDGGAILLQMPAKFSDYAVAVQPLDRYLQKLFTSIEELSAVECQNISQVFSNSASVIQSFLGRIFAQTLSGYLETYFSSLYAGTLLAYLRALSTVHHASQDMVSVMIKNVRQHVIDPSSLSATLLVIKRSHEDLFVAVKDTDKYYEKEVACMLNGLNLALSDLQDFMLARKVAMKNRGLFSKFSTPAATSATLTTAIDSLTKGAVNEDVLAGFHEQCVPSAIIWQQQLNVLVESVHRVNELCPASEVPRNVCELYTMFLEVAGRKYLSQCVELTLEDLLQVDPQRQEIDVRYLSVVNAVNQCVQLQQSAFNEQLVPACLHQLNHYRELVQRRNDFVAVVENKLNAVVRKIVNSVMVWVRQLLTKQKKYDYRPTEKKADAVDMATTLACTQCCEYLQRVCQQLSKYLDGGNLRTVAAEVMMQLYAYLLQHIRRFSISTAGGILLSRDLARYQELAARTYASGSYFDTLRQLGNLYIVTPDNLKRMCEELTVQLPTIPSLAPYLRCRADFKTANLERTLGAMYTQVASSGNGSQQSSTDDEQSADEAAAAREVSVWDQAEQNVQAINETFEEVGDTLRKLLF